MDGLTALLFYVKYIGLIIKRARIKGGLCFFYIGACYALVFTFVPRMLLTGAERADCSKIPAIAWSASAEDLIVESATFCLTSA
jgi:hypothetical protein